MKGSLQASGRWGCPAGARRPEHGVVVDADDAADPDALPPLQLGERAIEIGAGDALLGEHGVSLGAVRSVEPIAPSLQQPCISGLPRFSVSAVPR